MSKFLVMLLVSALLLSAPVAHAFGSSSPEEMQKFEQSIEDYSKYCEGECRAPYAEVIIFDEYEKTDERFFQIKDSLQQVAYDQVQVWGDTILEGDYVAQGDISLDKVVALQKNGQIIAYHITYSQKAWETANCNYDYENQDTLSDCTSGRISEASFVSPDFQLYFQDGNQYAEFSED